VTGHFLLRTREAADPVAADVVLLGTAFVALLLVTASVGFHLGIGIHPSELWIAAALLVGLSAARAAARQVWRQRLLAIVAVVVLGIISDAATSRVIDTTYDGMAYHQVSIISLLSGWNPVLMPHVVDWWQSTTLPQRVFADRIAENGLWTDHYPKASWLLGSVMVASTSQLNTAQWPQVFLAAIAVIALYRGLRLCGLGGLVSVACAVVTVACPVTIVQFGSGYVDGLLGTVLAIQVGASLAWVVTRRIDYLLVILASAAISFNLKFSGPVYSGSLMVATLLVTPWRSLIRTEVLSTAAAGTMGLLLVSGQTYAHNLWAHGHPFFPLNQGNIANGQIAEGFLRQDRFVKAVASYSSLPTNSPDAYPHASLVLPRPSHYRMIVVDTRVSGFGTFFGWSMLLAMGVSALSLWTARLRDAPTRAVLTILGWTVFSSALNPELWWARYVPQLWMFPVMAAVLAYKCGRRWLCAVTLVPVVLGSLLTATGWTRSKAQEQRDSSAVVSAIARTRRAVVLDGWAHDHGLFTFAWSAQTMGAKVLLTRSDAQCSAQIGLVRVCSPESPAVDPSR
jgi:hypothetical protein